ncbi:TetR family regulatory protein [Caballeronia choica]|uniref:TetR family regulatory protein n=1 Tax=Caballeronia choica TaxID=326476 RepID=A0A158L3G7_9BURK|nr:TetR family regulatory protein [Caballeronia choica]
MLTRTRRPGTALRNAIAKEQLTSDLDTVRASGVVHVFLDGLLRDWLLEQNSIVLPRDATYLADVCIGMLRHSPSLRPGVGMCIRTVKGRSASDLLRRVIGLMRIFP